MGAHMPLPRPTSRTKPPSSKLLEEVGHFDTRFKVAIDYFLCAYRRGKSLKVVDTALSVMRDAGISWEMDWPHTRQRLLENKAVHYKSCNSMLLRIVYFLFCHNLPFPLARAVSFDLYCRNKIFSLSETGRAVGHAQHHREENSLLLRRSRLGKEQKVSALLSSK
jgi:hypothetical protein